MQRFASRKQNDEFRRNVVFESLAISDVSAALV